MLTKKWFDKRAVNGNKWAVIAKHRAVYDLAIYSRVNIKTSYVACPLRNVPKNEAIEVLRDDLTKDEAMAMEKFLNFSEGMKDE